MDHVLCFRSKAIGYANVDNSILKQFTSLNFFSILVFTLGKMKKNIDTKEVLLLFDNVASIGNKGLIAIIFKVLDRMGIHRIFVLGVPVCTTNDSKSLF